MRATRGNRSKIRDRYIAVKLRAISSILDAAEQRIKQIRRNKEKYLQQLKDLQEQEAKSHDSLKVIAQENDHFGQEFDRLMAHPLIEKVEIDATTLFIFTREIHTKPLVDRTVRNLGRYRIEIPIGSNRDIMLTNLDPKPHFQDHYGYNYRIVHPHVYSGTSNRMCLGNIGTHIYDLLKLYEFSAVAEILVDFLRTINPISSYQTLAKAFPVVTTKNPSLVD